MLDGKSVQRLTGISTLMYLSSVDEQEVRAVISEEENTAW